jgi:putative cofactor-binding repeat protein
MGATDNHIYISGDSSVRVGRSCIISGNHFLYTPNACIASKREFEIQIISNNTFIENRLAIAVGTTVTGSSTITANGKKCVISNNYIYESEFSAIEVINSDYSAVTGNVIENSGTRKGTIRIKGSDFVSVVGNSINNRTRIDGSYGVSIEGFDGQKSMHSLVVGNVISGVSIGIKEQASWTEFTNIESNNIEATEPISLKHGGSYANVIDMVDGSVDFIWGQDLPAMSIQRERAGVRPDRIVFNYDIVDKNGSNVTSLISSLQSRIATLEDDHATMMNNNDNGGSY